MGLRFVLRVALIATLAIVGLALFGPRQSASASTPAADWQPVASYKPPAVRINAVDCPSAATGIAVGQSQNGWSRRLTITTDGGATWVTPSVPVGIPPLWAVTCPSTSDCYAVGQAVDLVTTDGGTSWMTGQYEPDILFGVCTSAIECIAVGTDDGYQDAVILTTSDGGGS